MRILTTQATTLDKINFSLDNYIFQAQKETDHQFKIIATKTSVKCRIALDIPNIDYEVLSLSVDLRIENCNIYNLDGSCQQCLNNRIVSEITGQCSLYSDNCYNSDQTLQKCLQCNPGYYLTGQDLCSNTCKSNEVIFDNRCVASCNNGFYNNNGFCEPCGNLCKSCTSIYQCTLCENGIYLQQGGCQSSCSAGYFPRKIDQNNQLLICDMCYIGCKQCSGPTNSECQTCQDTYILQNGNTCVTQCQKGYIKTTDAKRAMTTVNLDNKYYCAECYYTSNKECVESCPTQTFLSTNLQCKICSTQNCNSCDSKDVCTGCQNGYSLDINQLCIKCLDGQYFDIQERICKICPDSKCLQCTSQENGKMCIECKRFYNFNQNSLSCKFNDTQYLLECSNPNNCEGEQSIVKVSDAALSIISLTNTILLITSFFFFPLGPFFWYTVQVQQQIGNLILIDNLRILSLGPTVIQTFYQYNLFTLIPDSKINTYEEGELIYPNSADLSIMSAFRSQPLKKYFINNLAFYFIALFISLVVLFIAKYRNRDSIYLPEKPQVKQDKENNQISINQQLQSHQQINSNNSKNQPQSSKQMENQIDFEGNSQRSSVKNNQIESQDENQINQDQYNDDSIDHISEEEKKIAAEKQRVQLKMNSYQKRKRLLQVMEYNFFIRFQTIFGNYFLLSLANSFYNFSMQITFDYVDIGVRSAFGLTYFILIAYLTYKIILFDEQYIDFIEDFPKYDVLFRSIKRDGLKKFFWILLEYRKIVQIGLLIFLKNKQISLASVIGTNILFFIYLIHQRPIQNAAYQKFICAIELIIIMANANILAYIFLSDQKLNQKFILSLLTIILLTLLNIIVFGFLVMQVFMFIKFKFFPTLYVIEKQVLDTIEMRLDQSEDYKKTKLLNNLSNAEIDFYSQQWGINPMFVQKILSEAKGVRQKQLEEEEEVNKQKFKPLTPKEQKIELVQRFQKFQKKVLSRYGQQDRERLEHQQKKVQKIKEQQEKFKASLNNKNYQQQEKQNDDINQNLENKKQSEDSPPLFNSIYSSINDKNIEMHNINHQNNLNNSNNNYSPPQFSQQKIQLISRSSNQDDDKSLGIQKSYNTKDSLKIGNFFTGSNFFTNSNQINPYSKNSSNNPNQQMQNLFPYERSLNHTNFFQLQQQLNQQQSNFNQQQQQQNNT